MGERVRAAVADHEDTTLVGALEAAERAAQAGAMGVAATSEPAEAFARADVVIDFSIPSATLTALAAAADLNLPYVCGTTGFSNLERKELQYLAQRTPVVWAANFSVAVNVLIHLASEATALLGPAYDVEIVELHHGAKRDAPSGTALRLAEAVAGRNPAAWVTERSGETGPRPPGVVGIQALRGGDNPGEHTVMLLGRGERIELAHRATTRDHFAAGAVRAAQWVVGRAPGLYGMEDVLGLSSSAERSTDLLHDPQ
jgi:4-hydroxy-tetrahydrodipicolinate reductase